MAIFTPKRKTSSGTETVQFPISSINGLETALSVATQSANGLMSASDKKKLDTNVVTLDGTQTITGVKTFNAPTNVASTEQVTAWFNTANGGRIGFGKEQDNSGTGIFFDQVSGTRRLNFRASATAGAMVWEQPEKGAVLYVDLGAKSDDYHRISFPSKAGTLALTSQLVDTGATSVAVSGSGNAVTTASYDATTRKLTLTKGTTFLTNVTATAGSNINSVGTPSVTASTSNGVTTLTFNYLKGATGSTGATGATGVGIKSITITEA